MFVFRNTNSLKKHIVIRKPLIPQFLLNCFYYVLQIVVLFKLFCFIKNKIEYVEL